MTATREVSPDGKSRGQIRQEIKEKERAVKYLSERYATSSLPKEDIETLLYSIGDNNSYLTFNRDPVRVTTHTRHTRHTMLMALLRL